VLAAVRSTNTEAGATIAGYTHDAGAHVHVFTTRRYARSLRRRLASVAGVEKVLALSPGPGGHPIRVVGR